MLRRGALLLLVVAVLAVGAGPLLGGRAESLLADGLGALTDAGSSSARDAVRVVRVVDGDTVKVRYASGRVGSVRYIGVDTPESVKPGSPVECYAKRASAANRQLVGGRRVRLEWDRERRDRYGRALAYVHRAGDDLFVNAELVRRGLATPLRIEPNVAHAAQFRRLADRARHAGVGLWSACATP
jgi:micrococcal nuclease